MGNAVSISWRQALGWRMERQLLDPVGLLPVEEVVRRLAGVQAQVASSAELAVRIRSRPSKPGDVARALEDGRLIKTWAMRGTIHLLAPEDAGAILSLLAAVRLWERPSWRRYFGMSLERWDLLRSAAREALESEPLTREELAAAIASQGLAHLGEELLSGWGTFLKPLAWQGDLCYGPSREGRVTFTRPEQASPRWTGVLPPDDAAPIVIAGYLRAYGPATMDNLGNWLARGAIKKRQIRAWFEAMGDRLACSRRDRYGGTSRGDRQSATTARGTARAPGSGGPGRSNPCRSWSRGRPAGAARPGRSRRLSCRAGRHRRGFRGSLARRRADSRDAF